jgi:peroxiredoxin
VSLELGAAAPAFELRGVDGSQHSLAGYDGAELLVLVQFCNHCPYVLAWEGRVDRLARDYAARGVVLVAFNSNDAERYPTDSYERMVEHAAAAGLSFDYLHDREQTLARALGSQRTPEVFVFDRARRLRYHGAVDDNRDEGEVGEHYLRAALDALLGGQEPPRTETAPVGCSVKWLP